MILSMNARRLIATLFFIALVGVAMGYAFDRSYEVGLCFADFENQVYDVSCHRLYERIGSPLFYGTGALALVFLALFFVPRAFSAWRKFAIWYVSLALLVFVTYPVGGGPSGFFVTNIGPPAILVYQWVSGLYVLISLAIVGRVLLRGQKR